MQKKTIIGGIVFLSMVAILIAYHLLFPQENRHW